MRIELGADGRWRVYDAAGTVLSEWADRPQAVTAAVALAPSADGVPFTIPLLMAEGVWTSDGRKMETGTVTARACPLPVMMQLVTEDGHDGAFPFGRLDSVTRDSAGQWSASGTTINSPEAAEGAQLIAGGFITGISVDAAASVFEDQSEFIETDTGFQISERVVFKDAQIAGCTVCATPAFEGACIVMGSMADQVAVAASGIKPSIERAVTRARAIVASAELSLVTEPPSDWFVNPGFTDQTTVAMPGFPGKRGAALSIKADKSFAGLQRVSGHLALWGVPHTAYSGEKIYVPHSATDYAHFMTGSVLCADGKTMATGALTAGTGHPELELSAAAAKAHYDNTGAAVADVAVGEDEYGVWVAGYIRPGATREQVLALRASPLSGDWRPIGAGLELLAALAVNAQGFTIPRARVASGILTALVAAGGSEVLFMARQEPWRAEIEDMRSAIADLTRQLARYAPVIRPMVASAALDRAKAAQA